MHALLTVEQAAATLQLRPKTIKGWLREGKLMRGKIGRQWRVREVDLEAFIQASVMGHVSEQTVVEGGVRACNYSFQEKDFLARRT